MIPRANYQKQLDINLWISGSINTEILEERIKKSQHGGYTPYNDGTFISPDGLEQLITPNENVGELVRK